MTALDLEARAQLALEAQLALAADLIGRALGPHPHFDDDCGDYLASSLKLAAELMVARLGAPALLVDVLRELALVETPDDLGEVDPELRVEGEYFGTALEMNYAGDGVAFEVLDLVAELAQEDAA